MKTVSPKMSDIERVWHKVDATDKVLGRLSTQVASILRGKHKPYFVPNLDTGDFVVVVNAEKIRVTGNKADAKVYKTYSGYQSGLKEKSFKRMLQETPEQIIIHAVKGMLPKGPLGRQMLTKLKVYAGNEHPHTAQTPKDLEV